MRNLKNYAEKCKKMLEDLHIEYGNITRWDINSRAKHRWGQCEEYLPGKFCIEINRQLLNEENDEKGLIETILHELLHSCKGCMNHGHSWVSLAQQVNNKYNLNIKRTNSAADKGIVTEIPHKYAVKCPECGKIWYRDRMCNLVEHPERFRCNACKKNLVREF